MKTCRITDDGKPDQEQIIRMKEVLSSLPEDKLLEEHSNKLKALSDPTRLKILYLLSGKELCVCEIIYALNKPQSSISHHLNILKNLGFITGRKEGVWIHYKLKDAKITDLVSELIKAID
ncbi:MAG: winged helix-turn-helix transcriptional regulator [Methanobacterium sp.]|nr:winged helix-turn-helix transcriptional regulator [Methanobacterium sp.]